MENVPPMQEVMLEFRAGKMHMTGTRVVPDARRGLVRIGRGEEGLIHFQWLDRTQGVVEDDQIIFPDEACFEKVNQSSDRVFILKFNSDTRKYFFWMQEMQSDNDMDLCNSVNFYINQPLVLVDEEEGEATITLPISERTEDTAEDDISSRAGALVDQVHSSEISSEATSSGPVQLSDLQRILRNIHPIDTVGEEDRGLGLVDLLKPDLVLPLIRTLPLEQGLTSYLPEGPWTPEDVMELFQSPPFRQQMETFTHVLRTGQVDLSQFGIDPSKYKLSVLSFLEALDDSVAKASGSDQNESTNDEAQRSSGGDAMDESR